MSLLKINLGVKEKKKKKGGFDKDFLIKGLIMIS